MKLDQIQFNARPRQPWEAVDLGMQMARAWWPKLMLAWLALALPVLVLLWLLPVPDAWIPVVLWWLKPLYERPQLYILSRAVFGEVPSLRQTMRATPGLLASQWFSSLTWRRLSPSRSFDLPLVLLEGLGGKVRRQRMETLHRDQYGQSVWLTLIGAHVEAALILSMMALLAILIPVGEADDWFMAFYEHELLGQLLLLVAMALVAPFYVAGGFALYLNRRVHLEGWDIELSFRRLIARAAASGTSMLGLCALVLLGSFWGAVEPVHAQTTPAPEIDAVPVSKVQTPAETRQAIEAILGSEELTERRTTRIPKFLQDWRIERGEESESDLPLWLTEAVRLLAQGFEWLAWVVLAGLIVLVLVRYRAWMELLGPLRRRNSAQEAPPSTLFGLDVRAESIPEDIPAEVLRLWAQGAHREALGLLYRATLSRLLHERGYPFRKGFTEGECLRLVEENGNTGLTDLVRQLTQAWQHLAYAHRTLETAFVEQLCQRWQAEFQAPFQAQGANA